MRVATTKPWDLAVVAGVTLLTLLVVTLLPWPPLRVALGLLFVLVAPGYALVAALFPERPRVMLATQPGGQPTTRGLGALERAALSLGLSIAVVPLLGLLLNYTPWGIRLTPILVTLSLFTLGMSAIAYRRRMKLPELQRLQIAFAIEPPAWRTYSALDKALTVALALAVLVAGGALAYVVVAPRPGETFTEFYILGPGGKAEGYPTELAPGANGTIIVGLVNHEGAAQEYRVEVVMVTGVMTTNETGAERWNASGETTVRELAVSLDDEGKREENLTFDAPTTPGTYRLELRLYRLVDETPYRQLHLWVRVGAPSPP